MLLFVANFKNKIFKHGVHVQINDEKKRAKNVDLPPGDLNARLRTISAQNLQNFRLI